MSVTWAVEYRPRRFSEVAGQEHIAPVLRQMVNRMHSTPEGKFPPALVLYGPRGTGKTTIARILARALNCEDHQAGDPCGVCGPCEDILSGAAPGVTEIDMASHGSVEDIRKLKSSTSLAFALRWRVFLLDEVHSASKEAFNALLKILEESPAETLFLLITTEPDRIPDTIRSRGMEFEFRRIGVPTIVQRLRAIAAAQGVHERIDEGVYELLATRAQGGMRDAVMSLEQVCYHDGQITEQTVRETFGVSTLPEQLLDAALKGDRTRGFALVRSAMDSAVPPVPLVHGMIRGLTALIYAIHGTRLEGSGVSDEWIEAYREIPGKTVVDGLNHLWGLAGRMRPGDPSAVALFATGYAMLCDAVAPPTVVPLAAHRAAPLSQPSGGMVIPGEAVRTLSDQEIIAALNDL